MPKTLPIAAETLKWALLIALFLVALFSLWYKQDVAMPTVFLDADTEECVEVFPAANGTEYSCDDLPKKYHVRWIK